ncbi:MAG TPA: NAD(P)-dependent oxidoreductase [Rhodocyclaceae bacterium]|jgi:nucleoside-diphosphate-sugar epimerase|nr:NAD(P)-dependent oxidoreductase [Rhodocyclaceae bacterium]
MKVLVLGGTGHIGKHLLQRMLAESDIQPICASRGKHAGLPYISSIQIDTRDEAALTRALAGIDCVVNCVAGDGPSIAQGAETIVRSAIAAHCPRIVHLSSMAVYGRTEAYIDESAPFDPELGWYAQAKCVAEQALDAFVAKGGTALVLRPGCVYGPGSHLWVGRIGRLLQSGRLGDLGVHGDGWSNLVHVDDVCSAILAAIRLPLEAGSLLKFNLAAPDSPRWNEYFTDLAIAIKATPVRRVPLRQIKADAYMAGPVIKITEKIAERLKLGSRVLPDPIPPALLRFFGQHIQLNSKHAENTLGQTWIKYADGLIESSEAFLTTQR